MFYNWGVDAVLQLRVLSQQARWEQDGEEGATCVPQEGGACLPVYWAAMGGRRVPILKTLLTSACERNCAYCPFRSGRDFRRHTFRPEVLASQADALARRGLVRGVLLSSGIAGGSVATQDRLLKTATLLRRRGFRGYLHLKLMPGAEKEQIREALRLADRVSVNLEAPGAPFLRRLAPQKRFWGELWRTLRVAAALREKEGRISRRGVRFPSLVTQFVVGAAGETDADLLLWSFRLLREFGVARVYFSPFRPIADTPLEGRPPTPRARAHRLYRAFFLLRDYGFAPEELFPAGGKVLPADDPKLWWARRHLREQPVELNTAPREMLLRVPGIGPRRADALLKARREVTLRDLAQLQALGIPVPKAAPFILLAGRRPAFQPSLW